MNSNQHEKITRNCSDKWNRKFQPGDTRVQAWQKLGPGHIVHLLENAAFDARFDARELLQHLARLPWRIGATVHRGGHGDARGVDRTPHVTLSVTGRSYHLRCKELPALHVVQITT